MATTNAVLGMNVQVGSGVYTALNAVAVNVTSNAFNFTCVHCKASLQVILTGGPNAGTVTLQGSLDGVNFDTTGTGLAQFVIGTDTSGALKFVVDKCFTALQVVLAALGGGASPTVTALIGAY